MSVKGWLSDTLFGPWTESRLLSRKLWVTVGAIGAMIGLDITGRALQEATINAVRDIVIAFVGIQGVIDTIRYRVFKRTGTDPGQSQGGIE